MESKNKVKAERQKLKSFLSPFRGLGLLLLMFLSSAVHAQTFAEWWNQKSTQIKYLEQQIVALQVYGGYIRKGYQISRNGLGSISYWARGEFNLHSDHYTSLKTVNPAIRDNPKASAIADYATAIPGQFDQVINLNGMTNDLENYIGVVQQKILDECSKDISELQLVMTSGKAEMTDDERIKRLDRLYAAMKDKYAFTMTFCGQVKMYLLQNKNENQSIQTLKQYYGIN
ncbi:MAG: hypothetical protein ABIN91_04855 [Mucilaginibacter sp.]|uniref:hypothetical protein n=1 Tax=Mucilaginibacter sp. TaxID=1882438 RepID=UPI003264E3B4